MRPASLLVIAGILPVMLGGQVGSALALCDLTNYDRSPPPHIKGAVHDQYADFEWASDADRDKQQDWVIWNYIRNLGQEPLIANWPKGQIQISTIRPLPPPPDGITCRLIPVDCATDHPMDAPIWYSASNQQQDAKAYLSVSVPIGSPPPPSCATAQAAASPSFGRPLSSSLSSTYLDDKKQVVGLEFDALAAAQDKKFTLTFKYRPLDLVVGLGGLPQIIDPKQLSLIRSELEQRGISTSQTNISKFSEIDFSERKPLSFDGDWRGLGEQEFLFMWGKEGIVNLTFADASPPRPTEAPVILLDGQRKPILLTRIPAYLPAR